MYLLSSPCIIIPKACIPRKCTRILSERAWKAVRGERCVGVCVSVTILKHRRDGWFAFAEPLVDVTGMQAVNGKYSYMLELRCPIRITVSIPTIVITAPPDNRSRSKGRKENRNWELHDFRKGELTELWSRRWKFALPGTCEAYVGKYLASLLPINPVLFIFCTACNSLLPHNAKDSVGPITINNPACGHGNCKVFGGSRAGELWWCFASRECRW